ncbi:unnamed protein product, partial [Linum tenue]
IFFSQAQILISTIAAPIPVDGQFDGTRRSGCPPLRSSRSNPAPWQPLTRRLP